MGSATDSFTRKLQNSMALTTELQRAIIINNEIVEFDGPKAKS